MFAGHFENILGDSVNDQTKILVVNAAYFVGKWMKKFPESETKECPFRVNKVGGGRAACSRKGIPTVDQKIVAVEKSSEMHSNEASTGMEDSDCLG